MADVFADWRAAQVAFALFVAGAVAALAATLIWGALQSKFKSPFRLGDQWANARVTVADWSGGEGYVSADGELWRAVSPDALEAGDEVAVMRVDGLTLEVRKKQ